jgi:hypothetical protein
MPTDHAKQRKPYTFSATSREVDRLDAWAHHHNLNRSEAVRALIAALRIDGQTALIDFEDVEPHPGAIEAAMEASEARRAKEEAQNPVGVVAKARVPECFKRPSDLLDGRCVGAFSKNDANPNSPACPICWPEGMTARATRREAYHALARQRADEAEEMLKDALERGE